MITNGRDELLEKLIDEALNRTSWSRKYLREMIIDIINQTCGQRVKEAIESARSKDPLKCEFGHEIVSHKTADGWCCACDADVAFLGLRVEEARLSMANKLIDQERELYELYGDDEKICVGIKKMADEVREFFDGDIH